MAEIEKLTTGIIDNDNNNNNNPIGNGDGHPLLVDAHYDEMATDPSSIGPYGGVLNASEAPTPGASDTEQIVLPPADSETVGKDAATQRATNAGTALLERVGTTGPGAR